MARKTRKDGPVKVKISQPNKIDMKQRTEMKLKQNRKYDCIYKRIRRKQMKRACYMGKQIQRKSKC